ncbi:MAG TPA: sn-glycerol-3-phosphate ABC transporter ATP-binding protein UgpC [Acetobacteraceae bacterium]|nr:sn-glycerol-3-phosphate ABC transporter ATP-binding protein UgpC [Acetobacteraceae bacterium]
MATLSLESVRKSFGVLEVVHGIDLAVADREFIVLVGPSGCGKSTILRVIAGLEDVSAGHILIDNQVVNDREPKDRDIAMVFQDYALYPHMTVFDNMAFGLRYRSHRRADIRRRVAAAADVLDIGALLARMPRELSGGQRQRVAMGRAIVRDPKIFLFDEPLTNLDAKLRGQMRTELKKLRVRVATTTVYVTHDQIEAMTLADRIVVLNQGMVEQIGSPDDIYERPASSFVAGFMGAPPMNLLPAQVVDGTALVLADGTRIGVVGGRGGETELCCGIRPEDLTIVPSDSTGVGLLRGHVLAIEPLGPDTLVTLAVAGQEMLARLPAKTVRTVGERVTLAVDPAKLHAFDRQNGRRL